MLDVAELEQRAYIKIAVLWGRNARECHSELVEQHPTLQNCREVDRRVSERTRNKRGLDPVTSILQDAWLTTEFLSPSVL